MAGEITGKNLYVQWVYTTAGKGGAVSGTVTLEGRYRSFKFNRSLDKADITAGNDSDKQYLDTIKDKTADFKMLYQGTAGSAVHRSLAIGNWGSLIWGEEGTATGKPKYGMVCFVDKADREDKYDSEVEFDVTWQGSGAMLFDFESSGSVW